MKRTFLLLLTLTWVISVVKGQEQVHQIGLDQNESLFAAITGESISYIVYGHQNPDIVKIQALEKNGNFLWQTQLERQFQSGMAVPLLPFNKTANTPGNTIYPMQFFSSDNQLFAIEHQSGRHIVHKIGEDGGTETMEVNGANANEENAPQTVAFFAEGAHFFLVQDVDHGPLLDATYQLRQLEVSNQTERVITVQLPFVETAHWRYNRWIFAGHTNGTSLFYKKNVLFDQGKANQPVEYYFAVVNNQGETVRQFALQTALPEDHFVHYSGDNAHFKQSYMEETHQTDTGEEKAFAQGPGAMSDVYVDVQNEQIYLFGEYSTSPFEEGVVNTNRGYFIDQYNFWGDLKHRALEAYPSAMRENHQQLFGETRSQMTKSYSMFLDPFDQKIDLNLASIAGAQHDLYAVRLDQYGAYYFFDFEEPPVKDGIKLSNYYLFLANDGFGKSDHSWKASTYLNAFDHPVYGAVDEMAKKFNTKDQVLFYISKDNHDNALIIEQAKGSNAINIYRYHYDLAAVDDDLGF